MLTIRSAIQTDIPAILQFIKDLADYEKLSDAVIATEEKLKVSLFDKKEAFVLMAFWNQKPAGFALYFYNYSTFLSQKGIYLEDLFVDPEIRGQGIGKSLLKTLTEIALKENCGRLEWSVLDWNQSAIDFYLSIGAKPNDEWTSYRLTSQSMKKFVTE